MTSLSFHYSNSYENSISFENIIIISNSVQLLTQLTLDHSILTLSKITTEEQLHLIKSVAAKLSPTSDNGASIDFFIHINDILVKFTLIVPPTACSRHNTPSRSHAIASLVKSSKGTSNLLVFILNENKNLIRGQALAVARQFPYFTLKSASQKEIQVDIVLHLSEYDSVNDKILLDDIIETAASIRLTQRLVDTPPNLLHTDSYVIEVETLARELGCGIEVIKGKDLESRGFGGIWGVGKASEHLPALVVLSHVPAGFEETKSICLVGKGIVYDTGGLSIKTPGSSMAGMKIDMGGSAAVLGAFITSVKRKVNHRLHAFLCISENSVGPLSTRPDDVHTFLSGKTVEVNNTDAEGRLVLADGCYYASAYFNPSYIIDMATLTGAQLVATGKNHAAIYCNDDDLEAAAVRVGKDTGDLTFPIPYCPEFYRPEYKSQVADMKNSVADRSNAQASCAGQFIGNHLETYLSQGGKWLHVDMAGPVWSGERATGYGVALLYGLVKELSSD